VADIAHGHRQGDLHWTSSERLDCTSNNLLSLFCLLSCFFIRNVE